MKSFRRVRSGQLRHARCRHCEELLTYVDEVGWLDPALNHSYDICPRDPYGNHEPPRKPSRSAQLIAPRSARARKSQAQGSRSEA